MKFIISLIFIWITFISGLYSDNLISILEHEQDIHLIGDKITYLEDSKSNYTIDDVIRFDKNNEFKKNQKIIFNQKPNSSSYWIKVNVLNNSNKEAWLSLDSNFLWEIDYYVSNGDRFELLNQTGTTRPENSKVYPTNTFWFPLGKTNNPQTIFFRIYTERPISIPIYFGTILSLNSQRSKLDLFMGSFIGFVVVIFFFNLFLFLTTKDIIYFWYTSYIFSTIFPLSFLNNYSFLPSLFDDKIAFYLHSHPYLWIHIPIILSTIFSIQFLNLKKGTIHRQIALVFGVYSYSIIAFLNAFDILPLHYLSTPSQLFWGIGLLYLLSLGLYKWIKEKDKNSRFFCMAWIWIVFSLFSFYAAVNGWVEYSILLRNSNVIGAAMEVLMFSFALGDRINSLQINFLKLSQNQNENLEKKIEEKTSELKSNQDLLIKLTNDLNAILNNTQQSFLLIDSNYKIVSFNKTAYLNGKILFGRKLKNRESIFSFTVKDLKKDFVLNFKRALNGERSVSQKMIRNQNGEVNWYEFVYYPAELSNSDKLGVCLNFSDITDRKKAEISLVENEERLRNIGDNLPNGAIYQIIYSKEGKAYFPYIGRGIERIFGIRAEIIMEDASALRNLVHPDDGEYLILKELKSMKELTPFKEVVRHYTINGDLKWISLFSMPRRLEDGSTLWDGVIVDITQIKEVETAFKEAKELAEAASKAKSEFVANMSHEIRTPLNGVIGFTDLMLQTNLNEIQIQYSKYIQQSAKSLLDIINDILDFSKIEAGKLELEIIETNIIDLIESAADVVKYQASQKNLNFIVHIPVDVPMYANVDIIRLKQILINLLSNAVKFTEKGEVELGVKYFKIDESVGRFWFYVKDAGIGISNTQKEKLFIAFSQADTSTTRKFGGTGLGLQISKLLANKMASEIKVESNLGEGSLFHFELETKYRYSDNSNENYFISHRTILIKTNTKNSKIIQEKLMYWGINPILCNDLTSAYNEISSEIKIDTILLDVHMEGLNIEHFIETFKNNRKDTKDKLPIVLLINILDDHDLLEKYKSLGIQNTLVQPLKYSELFNSIKEINKSNLNFNTIKSSKVISYEKFTVLIVDDVDLNRILVRNFLKKLIPNALLFEAKNGIEAYQLVINQTFDFIFMDIQMPEMDGIDATIKIREIEKELNIKSSKIIALTAGALREERERALSVGMNDFLTKPVEFIDIQESLNKIISQA
jgi:PAS domain S-box-containing protein